MKLIMADANFSVKSAARGRVTVVSPSFCHPSNGSATMERYSWKMKSMERSVLLSASSAVFGVAGEGLRSEVGGDPWTS